MYAISSQYKKFIIDWEWDERSAVKEFEDDFCSPWLCWISDQPGQDLFTEIFEKIERQAIAGKKTVKYFLIETDGRWEISR